MENIYSTAKICDYHNRTKCDLALEPELTDLLKKSRDPEELKYIWAEWRNASGKKVKFLFMRYVELNNMAARLNNYSDNAAYWLKDYEADDFPEQIGELQVKIYLIKIIRKFDIKICHKIFLETLWQQLKPLYLQLHAYVRRELRKKYGENIVSKDGPIPAHLLGNMWAQTWSNIANFTTPYPGKQMPDVTDAMINQGLISINIYVNCK